MGPVSSLARLAHIGDPVVGGIVGEEEPVFVVDVRKESEFLSVAFDADVPALANTFLRAAAEAMGMTDDRVIRVPIQG